MERMGRLKTIGRILVATLCLGSFFSPLRAADSPDIVEMTDATGRLPGVSIAEGLSQVTGVAISPLLGVCGIGTWNYFTTPKDQRHLLPWFCHPLVWGIGYGILSLVALKDIFGTAAPAILKKPLDLIEIFEDKLSALVAGTAFVPFVTIQVDQYLRARAEYGTSTDAIQSTEYVLATAPVYLGALPISLAWLLVPLAIAGFFVVWLLSHAINVLLLLSPFGVVDAFLKLSKLATIGSLLLLYLLSPILAAILAALIIAVAVYLAPATFRLLIFGTFMSLDYLRSLVWKTGDVGQVYGFLARPADNEWKTRSYGTLKKNEDDQVVFHCRFLFFGPSRKLILADSERMFIDKGFIFPSLSGSPTEESKTKTLVHLLPRYRHHTEGVSEAIGVGNVRDHVVIRGFKAVKAWIADVVRPSRYGIGTSEGKTELEQPESGTAS